MRNEGSSALIHTSAAPWKYYLQLRDYKAPTWPGCFSLFGGWVEEGESGLHAVARELSEETNLFDIADQNQMVPLKSRTYNWDTDFERVLNHVTYAFPKLPHTHPTIPLEDAKGQLKGELKGKISNVFEYGIDESILNGVRVSEGVGGRLFTPYESMALVMSTDDRLALMDHFYLSGLKRW
jgi:8-oxo-dGTP pyrophosphatase MutT (NUDIX family)